MKTSQFTAIALVALFLFSAAKPKEKEVFKPLPKTIKNNFAYIPSGEVSMDGKLFDTQSFFISTTEVSHSHYNEFLADLKAKGAIDKLEIAAVKNTNWGELNEFWKPMEELYHSHPAYDNYPVVNVSYEAATLYCKWLTDKYNLMYPDLVFTVRLPQRTEWVKAAKTINNSTYAWGGPYLKNDKGMNLCNYKKMGAENITYNEKTKEYEVVPIQYRFNGQINVNNQANFHYMTAPVLSYYPNEKGIYNMNGNVAEITADRYNCGGSWKSTGYDVRNESYQDYDTENPYTGFRVVMTYVKK